MSHNKTIHTQFTHIGHSLDNIIRDFDQNGRIFGNQNRNIIKLFDLNGMTLNVKGFKITNSINQITYRFFRKSKAQRSFEYANKLLSLNIGTPQPIGHYEFKTSFLFKKSFYISEHLDTDLTYRDLTTDFSISDYEAILRAFTRFTYTLHEKGVNFLDHSPGNTLIKRTQNGYNFYLVDLNRMRFETMSIKKRIRNFAKLTIHKDMVKIMSHEYAKCTGLKESYIFNLMWSYTKIFQEAYYRKNRMKKRLFFWKKKYRSIPCQSPIS